jgi:hypothetical protein
VWESSSTTLILSKRSIEVIEFFHLGYDSPRGCEMFFLTSNEFWPVSLRGYISGGYMLNAYVRIYFGLVI